MSDEETGFARGKAIQLGPRKPRKVRETDLVHAIRAQLNKLDGVRIWRNNTGKLLDAYGRMVSYGLAIGSADLVGLVTCEMFDSDDGRFHGPDYGRFFALEVKTNRGVTTSEQKAWGEVVRSFGGFYAVVRSVEEAHAAVEEARR